jgi:hypothetical protein
VVRGDPLGAGPSPVRRSTVSSTCLSIGTRSDERDRASWARGFGWDQASQAAPVGEYPPTESISEGDVDRLFGRFSWGAYSPAGGLERNGFLWRQLRRRRERDAWTYVAYAVFAMFAFPILIGLILLVVNVVTRL